MRFTSALLPFAFAATACAQLIGIGAPADGSTVSAGEDLTVEILKFDSLTGTEDVSIAIGVAACLGSCPDPKQEFGQILFGAPYAPTILQQGNTTEGQSFTIQIPNAYVGENISLNVVHIDLVEGVLPEFEIVNVTVHVI